MIGGSVETSKWTAVVDEHAWLLGAKSDFLEEIAQEKAITNWVGTTSLVFRNQLLKIFATDAKTKDRFEELSQFHPSTI